LGDGRFRLRRRTAEIRDRAHKLGLNRRDVLDGRDVLSRRSEWIVSFVRHMVDRRRHGLLLVRTLPFHAAPIATAAPAPAPPAPASLTAGILGFAGSMRGVGGVRLLGRVLTGVFCLVGSPCRRSVSYGSGCHPV